MSNNGKWRASAIAHLAVAAALVVDVEGQRVVEHVEEPGTGLLTKNWFRQRTSTHCGERLALWLAQRCEGQ